MRTMLERMPENYYDHDEGFPGSVEQWYRPYEDELILYQPHDTPHSQRAMLSPTACAWNSGSPAAAYWLRGFPLRYAVPGPYGDEFDGEGHKYANRGDGWRATRLANAYALTEPDSPMRAVLLDLAQQQADRMLNVAMPSGITSRSGDIAAGGPFAANLNPNPWDLGHLPEGSTVARSIMTAIVANGAMALERSVFGDGRMIPLIVDSADSSYFHVVPGTSALKTPPSGHVIVGGLQIGQVLPETSYSVLDPSKIALETQWHLVYAFELTGSEHYLERAVEITGLNVSSMSQFPEREYQLTGSARVWWAYTPELVSLIQRTYE